MAGGGGGALRLGYYKQLLLPRPTANVHVPHVHSLHNGARQRCACVFLVTCIKRRGGSPGRSGCMQSRQAGKAWTHRT